jgi:hypothetical protein
MADPTRADGRPLRPSSRRGRQWAIAAGAAVVVIVVMGAIGVVVLRAVGGGEVPAFPSLVESPDPSITGTVAYVDEGQCVSVVAAGGGPSTRLLCLPPIDPKVAEVEGKPMGPQLVWLPDGRLEVTMVNMDVSTKKGDEPPEFRPSWQKIVDVRTGEVTDVPESQLPAGLNTSTRPTVSPDGTEVSFTSKSDSGHVTVEVTDADGTTRTLLDVDGPDKYVYGLRAAFWAPDHSYVLADDGRILVITLDDPSLTRELVVNANLFGDQPEDASFAVTSADLLPPG